jgi:FkbM family methyltransferase
MNEPRSIDELLRRLLGPGGMALDVGAHVGAKSERYLAFGARVVCVEPLPECVIELHRRFAGDPRVSVVAAAAGEREGTATLSICSRAPYLSTLSSAWKGGRFRNEVWDRSLDVPMTTLASLVERYGLPDFCKIDVEGHERAVLSGLDRRIPALSIEFAREALEETAACLARLGVLGYTRFNLAFGEGDAFAFPRWVDARGIRTLIAAQVDPLAWGDVYAFDTTGVEGAA